MRKLRPSDVIVIVSIPTLVERTSIEHSFVKYAAPGLLANINQYIRWSRKKKIK